MAVWWRVPPSAPELGYTSRSETLEGDVVGEASMRSDVVEARGARFGRTNSERTNSERTQRAPGQNLSESLQTALDSAKDNEECQTPLSKVRSHRTNSEKTQLASGQSPCKQPWTRYADS